MPGDHVARDLLYKAIEIDLAHFDWDKAVRQINRFRANARRWVSADPGKDPTTKPCQLEV